MCILINKGFSHLGLVFGGEDGDCWTMKGGMKKERESRTKTSKRVHIE